MSEIAFNVSEANGVARVTLSRADKHNAFDDETIRALTDTFERLGNDPAARVIVLAALGPTFCAGADLNWMRRSAGFPEEQNRADARDLGRLMHTLNGLPKPTIALVQGPAYGGGVGLVACCDIAIAASTAVFSLSEVKLGLTPSVISPFVIRAIGARAARRYFLTAERFDAETALRLGLVHEVVPVEDLDATLDRLIGALQQGGPAAQAEAKALAAAVPHMTPEAVFEYTADHIARLRSSEEAREGLAAFLEKRPPKWRST